MGRGTLVQKYANDHIIATIKDFAEKKIEIYKNACSQNIFLSF